MSRRFRKFNQIFESTTTGVPNFWLLSINLVWLYPKNCTSYWNNGSLDRWFRKFNPIFSPSSIWVSKFKFDSFKCAKLGKSNEVSEYEFLGHQFCKACKKIHHSPPYFFIANSKFLVQKNMNFLNKKRKQALVIWRKKQSGEFKLAFQEEERPDLRAKSWSDWKSDWKLLFQNVSSQFLAKMS